MKKSTLGSFLCTMILLPLLASCVWMKPAQKRVDENRDEIGQGFQRELARQSSGGGNGTLTINWPDAMERMYLSNPELIQADNQIENAREQQTQLWRNMLPLVGVGATDNFSIENLGEAFSSPQLRIYSYLPLGGLLQLPKDMYTRKLYYMGAKLTAEQAMRQQVIILYRLFQEQRLHEIEKRALDFEGQLLSGVTDGESVEFLTMRVQHQDALEAWTTRQREWRSRVGDFFMSGYAQVNLMPKDLPDIIYRPSDLDFSDTGRWGMLQLNLLAMEQIAEDGQILEAYQRYLPRPNFSVSAPPLYNSGTTGSFSAEGIRFGPALDWNLDTQGSISQQLRRIRSNAAIKDWRKDKRQRDEIARLLEGKEALGAVQAEQKKLRQAMSGYRKAVGAGLVKDPQAALTTMRKLREMEIRLSAREIEICTSFWLIDEQRWSEITRRWLQTRKIRVKQRR